MVTSNRLSSKTWWVLGLSAIFILLITVTSIGSVSKGIFDPKPIGQNRVQLELDTLEVPRSSSTLSWQKQPLAEKDFTVQLKSAFKSGEIDSGYGLAIGNDEHYIYVGISPLGYLTMNEVQNTKPDKQINLAILPWQTWPHVGTGDITNEIWVDVKNNNISKVRINREVLWQGEIEINGGKVGLWAESFGESVIIDFQLLDLYS